MGHNTITHPCEWCGRTNDECPCAPDDEYVGITPEGTALGHRYIMGNVNADCPKCTQERGICVLDCEYDLDK